MAAQKVALAVTSYNEKFHKDGSKTGAYYSEVYHPWKTFTDAGYHVDLITETGKFGWDESSIAPGAASDDELAVLKTADHPFNKAVHDTKKASEIDPKEYAIFYAAGGYGASFDFDGKAPHVAKTAGEIYDNDGIVSAVCHGPVILGHVRDKNDKLIIEGKKVTGFPEKGEVGYGMVEKLNEYNLPTVKGAMGSTANWVEPPDYLNSFTVRDGRVLTGINPASSTDLAKEVIAAHRE